MIRYLSKSDAKDMILISLCTRERQMLEMPYTVIGLNEVNELYPCDAVN